MDIAEALKAVLLTNRSNSSQTMINSRAKGFLPPTRRVQEGRSGGEGREEIPPFL